ncbi:peptidase S49 [Agaricicola taiwanensis]|uniref:Peptidase S49 n=1 Tax=Agaricicola taiwanensis TaxID=591372 RepID=A0A8J2YDZ1_9RHOB|nr:S49 family peptidase [Agaricicola taiwanensis]GGE35511.1 peptidase S49 [Agaricicola taiwanensis]
MADTSLRDDFARWLSPVLPKHMRPGVPVVPVVRLTGAIGMGTPLKPALTLASAAPLLEKAFAIKRAKEVAIIVNSPGGAPVQSHLIHRRIRSLAQQHGRKVTVFVEDVAASGGYMIACAGDEIIADPSSIVGSIGVVSAGFGFTGLIDKLGVERRVHTSGQSKVILDPFQPEKAEDVERLKTIQKDVHEDFIALVKERRSGALDGVDGLLFSGAFWTGRQGLDLGIVDRLGELRTVMRERYGDDVVLKLIGASRGLMLRRMTPRDGGLGAGLADEVLTSLEARALWSRFGL